MGISGLARGGAPATGTYLGLSTACIGCHADTHRAQFGGADCRSCHSMDAWKPATRIDHARTSYPLTGRHAAVACEKCHAPASDAAGKTFVRYRGLAAQQCSSCHADVHRGRLGPSCAACHTTAAWQSIQKAAFDHDKTAYPLRGRHVAVACEKCHRGGRTGAPAISWILPLLVLILASPAIAQTKGPSASPDSTSSARSDEPHSW